MTRARPLTALALALLFACSRSGTSSPPKKAPPPTEPVTVEQRMGALASTVATPSESADARAQASMSLLEIERIRGRAVGAAVLIQTLRELGADQRAAIAATLSSRLAEALGKATGDAGYLLKDVAFTLVNDESGAPLIVDAGAATRLKDALATWMFADLEARFAYTNDFYSPERIFRTLGSAGAAKLVPALATAKVHRLEAIVAIIENSGDAAAKSNAATALIARAKSVAAKEWREQQRADIEKANAAAGLSPTSSQLDEQLADFQTEAQLKVLGAMQRLANQAVAQYCLDVAADDSTDAKLRRAALAAVALQVAKVPDAADKLVDLFVDEDDATLANGAVRLLANLPRDTLAPLLYKALPKLDWKRRRLAVITLLKVSSTDHVEELLAKLEDVKDFHLAEAISYGAWLAEMKGDVPAAIAKRIEWGPAEARLAAFGYYFANGTRHQMEALEKYGRDPQEIPPCEEEDCEASCAVGSKRRRVSTIGDFVDRCVLPAMERRKKPPASPAAEVEANEKSGSLDGDSKAAQLASELAELDVQTLGALGSGPSGALAPPPASPAGPGSVSVGGAGVAGGTVANASAVVARMKGRFRACYQMGLASKPDLSGSVVLVARIGEQGQVESVSGGGSTLAAIIPCLKAVVQGASFAPPDGGSAVISIPITFVAAE